MYRCIDVYMYRCIYVYMYICIYVYMYICIYVYMHMCICIYVCMYICIYVYMWIWYMVYGIWYMVYVCMHVCTYEHCIELTYVVFLPSLVRRICWKLIGSVTCCFIHWLKHVETTEASYIEGRRPLSAPATPAPAVWLLDHWPIGGWWRMGNIPKI